MEECSEVVKMFQRVYTTLMADQNASLENFSSSTRDRPSAAEFPSRSVEGLDRHACQVNVITETLPKRE